MDPSNRPRRTNDSVTFAVVTCQMYRLDHAGGFHIYPAIAPTRFVASRRQRLLRQRAAGRHIAALARYHWQRMYSLPRHVERCAKSSATWEKDDHDTLKNDSWPGKSGLDLLRASHLSRTGSQARRFSHVSLETPQIWLTDGGDFRSPNTMKDGPNKTIWERNRKSGSSARLRRAMRLESRNQPDAHRGSRRANKSDNHANDNFKHEGDEIRAFFKQHARRTCLHER
jgi:alkaline phosphatase D